MLKVDFIRDIHSDIDTHNGQILGSSGLPGALCRRRLCPSLVHIQPALAWMQ